MSMGGGPGQGLDIFSLRHMDGHDWEGPRTFVIEFLRVGDRVEVARFNDHQQAVEWVDEAVARGEGLLEDYSLIAIPQTFRARHPWARVLTGAALWTILIVGGAIFVYFVVLGGPGPSGP